MHAVHLLVYFNNNKKEPPCYPHLLTNAHFCPRVYAVHSLVVFTCLVFGAIKLEFIILQVMNFLIYKLLADHVWAA